MPAKPMVDAAVQCPTPVPLAAGPRNACEPHSDLNPNARPFVPTGANPGTGPPRGCSSQGHPAPSAHTCKKQGSKAPTRQPRVVVMIGVCLCVCVCVCAPASEKECVFLFGCIFFLLKGAESSSAIS